VERVFDLAGLASQRDAANLPKLIEALEDPSEPMRWWAAQGCTMLGEQAAAAEAALRRHLQDESGAVAIAAAEALAALGKPELALPVLEHWLQQDDVPTFALQAANVLGRLGDRARGSLPTMKAAAETVSARKNGTYPQLYDLLKHTIDVLEGRTPALVYSNVAQANTRP
jgi:HEAT repeat protein